MDPDYLEEVLARIRAEHAVERAQVRRAQRQQGLGERRSQMAHAEDADV